MPLAIPFPTWIKPEIIPGFPLLRWYGMMYLVAFAITYLLFRVQVRERGLQVDKDEVANLFFWCIVGLIVGARLAAVTIYDADGYYARHPLQVIWPFSRVNGRTVFTGIQGMSYHGGLVGVVVAFVVYTRVRRIDTLEWGDMLVTAIPFGYFFGRLGNFINGELYGRVTSAPVGRDLSRRRAHPDARALGQGARRRCRHRRRGQGLREPAAPPLAALRSLRRRHPARGSCCGSCSGAAGPSRGSRSAST